MHGTVYSVYNHLYTYVIYENGISCLEVLSSQETAVILNVQVNGLIIFEIKFCSKLKLSKGSALCDYLTRLHHQEFFIISHVE